MPLFTHHAWRSDPGISMQGMNFRQRVNIMFPGLIPAFYCYLGVTVVKSLMGYPYLFEGGHKISFSRIFGVGEPHPVMGGHHGGHGHDEHHGEHHAEGHAKGGHGHH